MTRSNQGILLLALTLLVAPRAGAQCRAASDTSFDFVETVKKIALPTDSVGRAFRDNLHLNVITSASSVSLITKAATCSSANTAYQTATTVGRSSFSGKVYVVQVGKDYVVWDPAYRANPQSTLSYGRAIVFDSRWAFKRSFAH